MDIRLGVASYMMSVVEGETCIDRSILLEDNGFVSLFTSLLNVDKLAMQEAIQKLLSYVNDNF